MTWNNHVFIKPVWNHFRLAKKMVEAKLYHLSKFETIPIRFTSLVNISPLQSTSGQRRAAKNSIGSNMKYPSCMQYDTKLLHIYKRADKSLVASPVKVWSYLNWNCDCYDYFKRTWCANQRERYLSILLTTTRGRSSPSFPLLASFPFCIQLFCSTLL